MISGATKRVANGGTIHDTASGAGRGQLLRPGQLARAVTLGIVLWLVGALSVNYLAPLGVFGGGVGLVTFAASVPVGWITVWLAKWVAGLRPEQVVQGLTAGAGAAAMCDGVAMTWMNSLYGTGAGQILPGAAWILWVFGITLVAAVVEAYRTLEG